MPVLLGIPALITAIVSMLGAAGSAIIAFIAQRGIINVLFVAGYLTILAVFVSFLDAQIAIVLTNLDAYAWGSLVTSIVPTSAGTIIGIALTVDVARWIHDQSQAVLNRKFR